jgi:hypothetical protein
MSNSTGSLPKRVPLAWISEENYPAIVAILENAYHLAATWEAFAEAIEIAEEGLKASGHVVVRINVEPDAFADWCRREAIRIDTHSLEKFAALTLAKMDARNGH